MAEAELFDVIAVNITSRAVRIMERGKSERDADAIVSMAVMRRGVETEFYAAVPVGSAVEGGTWDGEG